MTSLYKKLFYHRNEANLSKNATQKLIFVKKYETWVVSEKQVVFLKKNWIVSESVNLAKLLQKACQMKLFPEDFSSNLIEKILAKKRRKFLIFGTTRKHMKWFSKKTL